MAPGPFKYRPLNQPDSIRLILLRPALLHGADIKCNMLHTTISQYDNEIIEQYTALSYVWGNALETKQISVDGHRVTITATLEAALRDLRDKDRILRVWADALCINQSNTHEKNHQVRQMGQIYATANHTVIYLGPLTAQIETVLKAAPSKSKGVSINLDAKGVARVIEIAERNLLNLPWFNRVWVLQELVLSRDPWVQCGTLRLRWGDLCSLLLYNGVPQTIRKNTSQGVVGLQLFKDMHTAREQRLRGPLFNLLLSRRGLGATDPRDMIFAHLGIISDRTALDKTVKVDYNMSCASVYDEVARHLVDTAGPEVMIFHTDDIDLSVRPQGLASWAPDWSLPSSYSVKMYRDNAMNCKLLHPQNYYTFTQEPLMLAYMGYDVDVIRDVSIAIPEPARLNPSRRDRYQGIVNDLQALYQSVGGSYASGDANGQYTHMPLRGKEEQHTRLCRGICQEWIHILGEELPLMTPSATPEELESHKIFFASFQTWLEKRPEQGIIFVGSDSAHMECLFYTHLMPQIQNSVLDGRRLAITENGCVAVVPRQSRAGDLMAYFGGVETAVVLRKLPNADTMDGNRKIREAFQAKDGGSSTKKDAYVQSFADLFRTKTVPIEHCALIGEGYVEGIVGWPVNQKQDHKIFALH